MGARGIDGDFTGSKTRPAQLVLVRHAESERNVDKKGNRFFLDDEARKWVQGVSDHRSPLTDRGRQQAFETGRTLRQAFGEFDDAYHSGYQRTRETLEQILLAYPEDQRAAIRVRHNPFLRERDTGYTFDMTIAEAETAFPWLQDYLNTYGPIFGRPPGGESLADVAKRVYLFLSMLFRDRAGHRVLVVSHAGTSGCSGCCSSDGPGRRRKRRSVTAGSPTCGVTNYEYDEPSGQLVARELGVVYRR